MSSLSLFLADPDGARGRAERPPPVIHHSAIWLLGRDHHGGRPLWLQRRGMERRDRQRRHRQPVRDRARVSGNLPARRLPRSAWRGPRDGRLTGHSLGIARVGGDDDAQLSAIVRDSCCLRRKRVLRRGRELPRVGPSEDGACEAPLARLTRRRVGIKNAHDPSGRAYIIAPHGAAAVQPLDRIPTGLRRSRQRGLAQTGGRALAGSGANSRRRKASRVVLSRLQAWSTAFHTAGASRPWTPRRPSPNCPLRMRCINSMPAIVIAAVAKPLKPSIVAIRCFTPRWSCSIRLLSGMCTRDTSIPVSWSGQIDYRRATGIGCREHVWRAGRKYL